MKWIACILLLSVWMVGTAAPTWARKWTDSSGKHTIEAELVDVVDGTVRLKRADGKVISLPLEKLSAADQQFLAKPAGDSADENPFDTPAGGGIKEGDQVEVNSGGRWKLAVVKQVEETSAGVRYHVIVDDDDRKMRVTDKRIRPLGGGAMAGGNSGSGRAQGTPQPGDKVQVRQGFNWKPATVLSVDSGWATVRVEGTFSSTHVPFSSLRSGSGATAGGGGGMTDDFDDDFDDLGGDFDDNFDKMHQAALDRMERIMRGESPDESASGGGGGFGGVIPAGQKPTKASPATPTQTRPVSLANITNLVVPTSAATSFPANVMAPPTPVALGRTVPVALSPKRDVFDEVETISVAPSGKFVAVLRNGFGEKGRLVEIVDMTAEKPSLVAGLPDGTTLVAISPDGTRLLSCRVPHMQFSVIFDMWTITDTGLQAEDSWEFAGDSSRRGPRSGEFSEQKTKAFWVTGDKLLLDSGTSLVQWDAGAKTPGWRLPLQGTRTFYGSDNKYLLGNNAKTGLMLIDTATGNVLASVGAGECITGDLSVSPSGRAVAIGSSQMFQVWNLATGQKMVWAANPSGSNGRASWTGSEHLLGFGQQVIDLRTMTPAAGATGTGEAIAGYQWDVLQSQSFSLSVTPATVSASQQPLQIAASNLPALLAPGGAVALDVRVDPNIQNDVRDELERAIQQRGFRLDNSAKVRIVATTRLGETKSEQYTSFFGSNEPITVNWQTHHYDLVVQASGRDYLKSTMAEGFRPPQSIRLPDGQSAQQYVDEHFDWRAEAMPKLTLPDYIFPMGR